MVAAQLSVEAHLDQLQGPRPNERRSTYAPTDVKSPPKSEAEGSIAQNAVGGIAIIESAGDSTIREDELPYGDTDRMGF